MSFLDVSQWNRYSNTSSSTISCEIPIGKGINDVQLLILNAHNQMAGIRELGEIYVRTPYLARDYIDSCELTQERFIQNPLGSEKGDLVYRTGDLGRYLPHGDIAYVGRCDRQINLNGFRIEPAEIETALQRHESIDGCIVLPHANEDQTSLVAFVTAHESVSSLSLRRYLKGVLPPYMIPAQFIQLAAVPLNANGKINYDKLHWIAQQSGNSLDNSLDHVLPHTELETAIDKIWQELLKTNKISIHDNFFDLGGHSFLVMKAIAKIAAHLNVHLQFRDFINHTLGQLAASCEEKTRHDKRVYCKEA